MILEEQLARAIRKLDARKVEEITRDLELPPFPRALFYLWRSFNRIRRRKSMGFATPNPIEWPDIKAFMFCTKEKFAPWEIELIESLDDLYLMPHTNRAQLPKAMPGKNIVRTVDITDGQGVRSLLRSVGRRRKPVKKGK